MLHLVKRSVDAEVQGFLEERTDYLATLNKLIEIDKNSSECHKCGRMREEAYALHPCWKGVHTPMAIRW